MATAEHVSETPGLTKNQVSLAAKALLEHQNKRQEKVEKKRPLFDAASKIQVLVTVWRIPPKESVLKIGLPHSARSEGVEVCLFTKDEPKMSSEQTANHYMKLLQQSGVKSITRVIPYQTLKKEYKPYEAKLKLLRSYDLFLADSRIRRLLPSHLGRHFYVAKKAPLSVNLMSKDLNREMSRFISGTTLPISKKGNCNTVVVGNTGMAMSDIVENVLTVASTIAKKGPGGWRNVKILHMKSEKSVALPIYTAKLEAIATVLNRADLFKAPANETKPKKKKKRDKAASTGDVSQAKKAKLQADGEPGALPTTETSDIEEEEVVAEVAAEAKAIGETSPQTPGATPRTEAKRKPKRSKSSTPSAGGGATEIGATTTDTDEAAVVSFLSEVRRKTPLKTPDKNGAGDGDAKRDEEQAAAASPAQPLRGKVAAKTPEAARRVETPRKPTVGVKEEEEEVIVTASGVAGKSETPERPSAKTPGRTPKQKRAKTPSKPASDDDDAVEEVKEILELIDVDASPVAAAETPAKISAKKTPGKTPRQKKTTKAAPTAETVVIVSDSSEEAVSPDDRKVSAVIELSDTEQPASANPPAETPRPTRAKAPAEPVAGGDRDETEAPGVGAGLGKDALVIELSDCEETAAWEAGKTPKLGRRKTPAKRSAAATPGKRSVKVETEEPAAAAAEEEHDEEADVVMELPARTPRRRAALAANEAIVGLSERRRSSDRRTRSGDASASETGSECGSDAGSGLEDGAAGWAARRGVGGRRSSSRW